MALTTTASTPTIIVPKSSSPFGAGLARELHGSIAVSMKATHDIGQK
jgi:hypothetical protein